VNIFRIFLLLSFFEPVYTISMNILYGIGKPAKAFQPFLLAAPLFFLANLLLIPLFRGYGAAVSFGLTILTLGIMYLICLGKEVGISLRGIAGYMKSAPGTVKQIMMARAAGNF